MALIFFLSSYSDAEEESVTSATVSLSSEPAACLDSTLPVRNGL